MKPTLRILGIAIILAAITFSCNNSKQDKEVTQNELPNIILLMGDDHGWDEVGYNGHPFVKTPVLDEMASSGLRFDRFYSGHPSCSPTRGSFMTGRHPNRYGTFSPGWSIRPEEITIAHLGKKAGYATAHFGKWHLGPVKKDSPTNPGEMGFDEYVSHDNFFELNPVMSRNGEEPEMIEGESSEIVIDEAIKFIQKNKNQPFLVVVWFGSPHEPYQGLTEDLALYDNLPDSLNNSNVSLTSNKTGTKTTRPLGDVLRERYAEITAMDRAIGKLRTYLDENNIRDNTMLWYCGDNGVPSSAGRTGMTIRAQKGSLYEGGVLVPGVLEWPAKIKKPVATKAISVTSDFLPTLAELSSQQIPDIPIDGTSLVPVINNPENGREQALCFWKFDTKNVFGDDVQNYISHELQVGTTPLAKKMGDIFTRNFRNYVYKNISESDFVGERTIMSGNFKLMVDSQSPNESGYELYDIEKDRAETQNIADKYPEKVKEMSEKLREWQESVLNSLTGADYKN
ncbi:MAG: sulfatase-like hydrolase/transferase [Draconibacterium sp.]|nr:sulfatase-like hydrolase/transferase [Draconibacterium sp.]